MKYTLKDILSGNVVDGVCVRKIIIPMLQRDYAQGREDDDTKRKRARFLEALHGAVTGDGGITLDFVYGEIDENTGVLTPLDGQQRLTTLFLLYWYAAVKEGIGKREYLFLENFSYETRASSREFCKELVGFVCDVEGKISEEIKDQTWFPLDWNNDPTIKAMLVMLDEIGDRFKDVDNLWNALVDEKKITFYFLPVENIGLTDEIYIKMNSRGKPLTPFEELKAELEDKIGEINPDKCKEISSKFDTDWTDLLWKYTKPCGGGTCPADGSNYIVDDAFMNCFRFVCDIISYRETGRKSQGNYFDLIESLFSSKCSNAVGHIKELETFFNCWLSIEGFSDAKSFCLSFVSSAEKDAKIMRSADELDIFEKFLTAHSYDSLKLPDKILLYSVVIYLQNQKKITHTEFTRRIRIINNLVENSRENILFDRDNDDSRIRAVFEQVDTIMLDGIIRDNLDANFNKFQIQEEMSKIKYLEEHPGDSKAIFILENHHLLKGQVGIVLLDSNNIVQVPSSIKLNSLVLRFYSLFKCNPDKINCALMTYGNYSQYDGPYWRRRIGSRNIGSTWSVLFHKNEKTIIYGGGYYKTQEVLWKLLESNEEFSNDKLDKIISDYITKCEQEDRYPWEYYFAKYKEFRPDCKGKLSNSSSHIDPYLFMVMFGEKRTPGTTYIPYMYCALNEEDRNNDDRNYYDTADHKYYIRNGNKYLKATNSGFAIEVHNGETVIDSDTLDIKQIDGVDSVNRIEWLRDYLYSEFFGSEDIRHQS